MTIVIVPARPVSSSVPESGTTVTIRFGTPLRHGPVVLEDEAAPTPVERAADQFERDVGAGAILAGSRRQHLSFAAAFEVAVELLVEEEPAERPAGRDRRQPAESP